MTTTRAQAITDTIIVVGGGEVVACGPNFFHVTDVREPSHPAAPGMVWHGSWWKAADGVWGEPTIWHITPDNCPHVPQILTAEDRAKCGWSDL